MQETRYQFVKDAERTRTGFKTPEDAHAWLTASGLPKDGPDVKTRVRYRSRTNTYDVVVKVRREVKE